MQDKKVWEAGDSDLLSPSTLYPLSSRPPDISLIRCFLFYSLIRCNVLLGGDGGTQIIDHLLVC